MSLEPVLAERNSEIIEVEPSRTLKEVAKLMTDNADATITVVASRGVIVGLVSHRDIIRAIAWRGVAALDDAACVHMTSLYFE